MKESAAEKRLILIREILDLSDEEILAQSEPDATQQSHEGGNPHDPPPGDPPGG